MRLLKNTPIFYLILILSMQVSADSHFSHFSETVSPEEFRDQLHDINHEYIKKPELETRYLSLLSYMSSYLVDHPLTEKLISEFYTVKSNTACTYCRNELEELEIDFQYHFGLDGETIPSMYGGLYYLPPGENMLLHNHLNSNAVLVVLKGELRSINFEIQQPPVLSKFMVKQTKGMWMSKGEISNFGVTRDNLHEIYAGDEGVLFLSIYTDAPGKFVDYDFEGDIHRSRTPIRKGFNFYFDAGWIDLD